MNAVPFIYEFSIVILFVVFLGIAAWYIFFKAQQKTKVQAEEKLREKETNFRLITENMTDLISVIDTDCIIQFVSPSHEKMLGYKIKDFLGQSGFSFVHPDDLEVLMANWQTVVTKKETIQRLIRYRHQGGHYIVMEANAAPILDNHGNVSSVLIASRDIQERLAAEEAMKESEAKFRLIAENSFDLIGMIDEHGTMRYVSPSHQTLLGYLPAEIEGRHFANFIHPTDLEVVLNHFDTMVQTKGNGKLRYRVKRHNDEYVWIESQVGAALNKSGSLSHLVIVSRDISDRIQYEEKLRQMAFYDSLTGVPNRRLLYDRLGQIISAAKRNQELFALLYLDFDRFKWVNDTMGHDVGDELLKQFVERIQETIRDMDTISRLGGDEFAIILPHITTSEDIGRIAERILQTLEMPWSIKGSEFITTSSIGISIFPFDGENIDTLLGRADHALYEAKAKGRNQYQFYTKDLDEQITRSMKLENGLKRALKDEHFHLVYQPQINLQTNEWAGMEVLLRYEHPTLGPVSPAEFIPVCEKIGLIHDITEWVLKTACRQHIEWQKLGLPPLKMAINISPSTLEHQHFYDMVTTTLDETNMNPGHLEFEITENALMENIEDVTILLKRLARLGISISLDDFGSGYSSLLYFKRLPIVKIKIDKSLADGLPHQEKDKAIIDSILTLANRLHIDVLCEGVETKGQAEYLKENGCHMAQGFFYSRPLKTEDIEKQFIMIKVGQPI
ncbi:diguanylate cyclase (GGDEF)-like protein/PAS domain S-box-containing protein [Bacillus fengqiuensis]|nr:diguanylate cyclase (GGDEF)-like protein/PAS domain S-box-containing protein [Bacillus fengqiuensis]